MKGPVASGDRRPRSAIAKQHRRLPPPNPILRHVHGCPCQPRQASPLVRLRSLGPPSPERRHPAAVQGNRTTSAISDAPPPRLHPKGRVGPTNEKTYLPFRFNPHNRHIRYFALRRNRTLPCSAST